jgi:hypothetical protein
VEDDTIPSLWRNLTKAYRNLDMLNLQIYMMCVGDTNCMHESIIMEAIDNDRCDRISNRQCTYRLKKCLTDCSRCSNPCIECSKL